MKIRFPYLLIVLCVLSVLPVGARAATFTVTNTNDSGAGSLRQAVLDANAAAGADEIRFSLPAAVQTITLRTGEITFTDSVTVNGTSAKTLIISGNGTPFGGIRSRVFRIVSGAAVTLNNLTVRDGNGAGASDSNGGGIRNEGLLSLNSVAVTNNSGSDGGGIYSSGNVGVNNSLIAYNFANRGGGSRGGGIFNQTGTCVIVNSTVFFNDSNGDGGGIYNQSLVGMTNVTFVKNNSNFGAAGAIYAAGGATTNIRNSLVEGNTSSNSAREVSGAFTSIGYNFIGRTAGSTGFGETGDILNQNNSGVNGDLADNGGETLTARLEAGGLAINAGDPTNAFPTDQRGYVRPAGGRADIGAFESNSTQFVPGAPDLRAASDSGISSTDNLTNSRAPIFDLTAAPGSTIELLRDGVAVDRETTDGGVTLTLSDPNPPANGTFNYAARLLGNTVSSASVTVIYDTTAPTAAVNQASNQTDPTVSTAINFTAAFSEPVYNFDTAAVVLGGTAGANAAVISGSASSYNIAARGMTQSGTVTATITANAATDAAGNGNDAPTVTDNTVTYNLYDYIVNTTNDATDAQGCDAFHCSLREAINAVNAGTGGATANIGFADFFRTAPRTIQLGSTLTIRRSVNITGAGGNNLTVVNAANNRAFAITTGSNSVNLAVTLSDLTLSNLTTGGGIFSSAFASASGTINLTINNAVITNGNFAANGVGILNGVRSTLVLNNSTISNNNSQNFSGSGIYNEGAGTVTINDSILSGNTGSSSIAGSGISNNGAGSTVSLNRTTMSGNTTTGASSSISNSNGTLMLTDSTVTGGTLAGSFSLISSSGSTATATLIRSTVRNNTVTSSNCGALLVGGIFNTQGTLTLENSTVSGNTVNTGCSGSSGIGGITSSGGTVNLTASTVSGNTANAANGGSVTNGGIAIIGGASGQLINVTISGNRALNGINANHGGILNDGTTSIINSTVTDNEASSIGANSSSGITNFGSVNIRNTIVADNRNSAVRNVLGGFVSRGNNFIGNAVNSAGWTQSDVTNAAGAARLAPLADNGGTVRTHALLPESPLIDKGSNCVLTQNGCGTNNPAITTDTRGANRSVGANVDIGAFEYDYACGVDTISINAQPQSVSVVAGQPIIFSVGLTGRLPRSIQWQISNNGGATWADVTGANGATLNLGNADIYDSYTNVRYRAIVTPICGAPPLTTNAATVTVNPATGGGGATCENLSVRASGWFRAANNANDEITGQTGFLFGNATFGAGKTGRAFSFDGFDDAVVVPSNGLRPPSQVSVEAWVNFRSLTSSTFGSAPAGTQFLVFKKNSRGGNFEGYALFKERNQTTRKDFLAFIIADRNGLQQKVVSSVEITTGSWFHVVGTFDGAFVRIYINGQNVNSIPIDPNFTGLDYDTSNVIFGSTEQSIYDGRLSGLLDEVKIYSQALTASEILANYNADSAGTCLINRWTGATNTDWANASNWSAGAVPTGADTAYIFAAGSSNSPTLNTNAAVGNLNISGGRAVIVNPNVNFTVTGAINVNGVLRVGGNFAPDAATILTGGGSFIFDSPTPQTIPAQTYPNLTVANANKTLGGNVTVLGQFDLAASVTTGASKITLAPNATTTRTSGYVIGNVEKQFAAGASSAFTFPVGTPNGYSPVTAANNANGAAGSLTVSATQSAHPTSAGVANRINRFWTLNGTGGLNLNLTFNYLNADVVGDETPLRLQKIENGTATAQTDATIDTGANTATLNNVTSFSDWTLFGAAPPTAANSAIIGRVSDADGRGVFGAVLFLTDQNGSVRYARTNPFGYYRFAEVPAGAIYVVAVKHKQHGFTAQIVTVNNDLTELNFVAAPSARPND